MILHLPPTDDTREWMQAISELVVSHQQALTKMTEALSMLRAWMDAQEKFNKGMIDDNRTRDKMP